MKTQILLSLIGCMHICLLQGQQVPDTSWNFPIDQPVFSQNQVIYIDEAHHNFHTKEGGFWGFSKLLQTDGAQVESWTKDWTDSVLPPLESIFVIANPLNQLNVQNWQLPTPSAFSNEEIKALKKWVEAGGSLLLIADHMPFAGAAFELASAFGFSYVNGFARMGPNFYPSPPFTRLQGDLHTQGLKQDCFPMYEVDSILSFTGSAFRMPEKAQSLLSFQESDSSFQTEIAWRFEGLEPTCLFDYHQGAVLNYGKGKIAVFGEAAMFTTQLANGRLKVGMNHPNARSNAPFVLNVIHWLACKK